jgi:hypothetical protein
MTFCASGHSAAVIVLALSHREHPAYRLFEQRRAGRQVDSRGTPASW